MEDSIQSINGRPISIRTLFDSNPAQSALEPHWNRIGTALEPHWNRSRMLLLGLDPVWIRLGFKMLEISFRDPVGSDPVRSCLV